MSDTSQGAGWWLASDGKWYPPQPPAPAPPPPPVGRPQRKRPGCLAIIGGAAVLLVLLVIVIVIVAVAGSKSTKTNTSDLGGSAPSAAYKVGDTADTSGYKVAVFSFKDPQPPTNAIDTPDKGKHFVSVDVQVTNPGAKQQSFSSLIVFHLLDSQNHQYDEDLTNAGLSPGPPEGEIAGGQSIRGWVVFQVPDGTTGLKLRVQGSITAAGAVFTL